MNFCLTILALPIVASEGEESSCKVEKCNSVLQWEDENPGPQLRSWVTQQRSKNKLVICREEKEEADLTDGALPLYKIERCDEMTDWTTHHFTGSQDEQGRFKGKGELQLKQVTGGGQAEFARIGNVKGFCIKENSFMSIRTITGSFKAGLPEGQVRIGLKNGGEMEGEVVHGVLHGKVLIRGKANALIFSGRYKNGYPEGPAWIFSPTDSEGTEGALYVHFKNGQLVTEGAVVVLPGWEKAIVGRYQDGAIVEGHRFSISKYRDEGCVRQLKVPKYKKKGEREISSPVRVASVGGRLTVASSRLLLFNRVAKVGSQSMTRLMAELSKRRSYSLEVDQRLEEEYNLAPWHQIELAERLAALPNPTVWVRHLNYIDFNALGLANPQWLGLVRDPVERVISNFYYRRAGWNIVERAKAFPNEPLPDPAFLRRDFESCVLEGDAECLYIQRSTNSEAETGDHRRQMMQFCGQMPFCTAFNSRQAMEEAKKNVEVSYPVVGVVELWDETLEVLEHTLPFFFKGATEMYTKKKKEIRGMSQNFHKGIVSEEVKEMVRKNFTMEIEFYQFAKKRLLRQLKMIRKNKMY